MIDFDDDDGQPLTKGEQQLIEFTIAMNAHGADSPEAQRVFDRMDEDTQSLADVARSLKLAARQRRLER